MSADTTKRYLLLILSHPQNKNNIFGGVTMLHYNHNRRQKDSKNIYK
uniref:Uncharacterized protein n=1 Tax=Arundo donax TaxID=35708 RepID=A0A0A9EV51_ARUDO